MSELEARLATPLVVRGGRRVTVTGAREVLVARARQLLRDADEAVNMVKRHREGQVARVRLASSSRAMVHLLPQILEVLDAERPRIDVQVTVGRSAELMGKLFVGDVDLALLATPQAEHPGVRVTPWRQTPMLPPRWEAPQRVTPQWPASRPLIFNEPATHLHQQVIAWFGAAGLHPTTSSCAARCGRTLPTTVPGRRRCPSMLASSPVTAAERPPDEFTSMVLS